MSANGDGISKEEELEVDWLVYSQVPSQQGLHGTEELYNRLGSWELLSAVVSLLHTKLLAHPETRVFFVDKGTVEMTHILRHMATFLSCSLTGHLTLSPRQLWDIHKHMLWHPNDSAASPGASNSHPGTHHGPGGTSAAAVSGTMPTAGLQTLQPVAADPGVIGGQGRVSTSTHSPPHNGDVERVKREADGFSSGSHMTSQSHGHGSGHMASQRHGHMASQHHGHMTSQSHGHGSGNGSCKHTTKFMSDYGGNRPVLGPRHVSVMTQLLKDVLVEVDAKQELIDDMVKVVSGASYLFERGDIFLDSRGEEAKWQHGLSVKAKHDREPQSEAIPIRASRHSLDRNAKQAKKEDAQQTAKHAHGLLGHDCGQAETPSARKSVEEMRDLFASW